MPDTVTWIDANGVPTVLGDGTPSNVGRSTIVLWGRIGDLMPDFDLLRQELPSYHGTVLHDVRVKERMFKLPFRVSATTEAALRIELRRLAGVFDPMAGDGVIRVTDTTGSARDLYCRYSAGALQISMPSSPAL